jgi:hypothetical protein
MVLGYLREDAIGWLLLMTGGIGYLNRQLMAIPTQRIEEIEKLLQYPIPIT